MATIIRSGGPIATNGDITDSETHITTYWGNLPDELMFVIPFWQVSRMLSVSGSNQIALRVTNITDPANIYVNWVVFEESMADTLQDPVEPGIYYFILEDSFFNGPVFTNTNPIFQFQGIRHASSTPEYNVIWARIGKTIDPNDASEEHICFFLAAQCTIIGPGGGGGGALTGARVPRP